MKAVVGGTVTQVRDWAYNDKQGVPVPMLEVNFFSGTTVDTVAVPPSMGRPEAGDEAFYVADVRIRQFTRKDGSNGSALSAWASAPYGYENPFVLASAPPNIKAVKA